MTGYTGVCVLIIKTVFKAVFAGCKIILSPNQQHQSTEGNEISKYHHIQKQAVENRKKKLT